MVSGLKTMEQEQTIQYAVCINSHDPDLLTPRMVYQILPDESAARSNYVRVIDNEGEDYLYPADYFILIDLPREVEVALFIEHLQPSIS
jgi:hypothetical protein